MGELGTMGGTRDFLPDEMIRREYVIDTLKAIFRKYGFEPLETPAIERWETLAGKYGEEGEKLIYHVVSSGSLDTLRPGERTEHALRYDLTVPLARVAGMYGDQMVSDPADPKKQTRRLPRPFKRYQIQPVWRGDRPGEGRYREFHQCDADVVGSTSPMVETELIALTVEAFKALGFADFTVKINHRQLLKGLIERAGIAPAKEATVLTSIDKLDKLPPEKVRLELADKGLSADQVDILFQLIALEGTSGQVLEGARSLLSASEAAQRGIGELAKLLNYLEALGVDSAHYRIDLALARGLDYYTGTIFETVTAAKVGSVGAGGRYDRLIYDLSGGKADQPACGTSFGLDRILAAMDQLGLFARLRRAGEVLVLHFGDPGVSQACFELVRGLREAGVRAELGYHEEPFTPNGMRQQLGYANEKGFAYAVIVGPDEMAQGQAALRDLTTRRQEKIPLATAGSLIVGRLRP
ncbi:histidine--tRNA ligase [Gloeobacter morelensis]|uniref:Histidine--tRNA ligase n=1 Tax=Gloeobacter morelensis MG652769 TaxID=2781736 RepID=A0ABY3PLK2_9CYAN|nr:histidine--tRNA ligase [Gloeobacter morelensis]UFP94527.1 histidine--tRNA ligase [Gloeobacter morelensis MG652769]